MSAGYLEKKERDWDEVIICICKRSWVAVRNKNIDSDHRGAVHTGHVQRYVPRAFWDPYGKMEDLPVAVVNNDQGAVLKERRFTPARIWLPS